MFINYVLLYVYDMTFFVIGVLSKTPVVGPR